MQNQGSALNDSLERCWGPLCERVHVGAPPSGRAEREGRGPTEEPYADHGPLPALIAGRPVDASFVAPARRGFFQQQTVATLTTFSHTLSLTLRSQVSAATPVELQERHAARRRRGRRPPPVAPCLHAGRCQAAACPVARLLLHTSAHQGSPTQLRFSGDRW